jgi:hypothetical protein
MNHSVLNKIVGQIKKNTWINPWLNFILYLNLFSSYLLTTNRNTFNLMIFTERSLKFSDFMISKIASNISSSHGNAFVCRLPTTKSCGAGEDPIILLALLAVDSTGDPDIRTLRVRARGVFTSADAVLRLGPLRDTTSSSSSLSLGVSESKTDGSRFVRRESGIMFEVSMERFMSWSAIWVRRKEGFGSIFEGRIKELGEKLAFRFQV